MTTTEHPPAPPEAPFSPAPAGADDRMTAGQWARLGILGALLVVLTATSGFWGLVIVLGIVLMVFLHELGHFVAAKRAGMKVTEFFIGFGPRIWSFTRGETEYGLKVIPAGAYVKIIGMHNLEEVAPEDEARSYRQGRFRDRFTVVVAGPFMNLLTALVLIWIVLAVVGAPNGSLTKAPDQSKWTIDRIYPGTGAAEAGLKAGDHITAVNGHRFTDIDDLRPLIQPHKGGTVQVTYLRGGVSSTVPVTLHAYTDEDGGQACCLGIRQVLLDAKHVRVNPLVAIPRSFQEMGGIFNKTFGGLGHFFSPTGLKGFGNQIVHAQSNRDAANTPGGTVPAVSSSSSASGSSGSGDSSAQGQDRLVSLVGVFQIGTSAASSGVGALFVLFILLNISLGIVNLLPLLPLDGGHAVIAVYEKVQEKRRHLSGRYFTDVGRLMPVVYVVMLVLVGIFVTTTYLDLANPLKID